MKFTYKRKEVFEGNKYWFTYILINNKWWLTSKDVVWPIRKGKT